jgi:hypothetical protein
MYKIISQRSGPTCCDTLKKIKKIRPNFLKKNQIKTIWAYLLRHFEMKMEGGLPEVFFLLNFVCLFFPQQILN